MDKIWNPQAWPKPLLNNQPISSYLKSTAYRLTTFPFPPKHIDYLITICLSAQPSSSLSSQKSTQVELLQLTLSISSRYMNKNTIYSQPIQLILLVSLFLASKLVGIQGGFRVNELHKFSNHAFTNKDFYKMEKKIIDEIGFDLMQEGICDRHVKILLHMINGILDHGHLDILIRLTEDIQCIIWHYLFTKPQKQNFLKLPSVPVPSSMPVSAPKNSSVCPQQNLLSASIIQVALILCTQCIGRFPATVWMIHVLQLKEDQLSLCVEDLLKIVVGRDKFEEMRI